MAKKQAAETLAQEREWWKEHAPKGTTVYTILRHVSRSGMRREIGLVVFGNDGQGKTFPFHPNWSAAALTGRRLNSESRRDGVICDGCGMDMGFDLVYSIGQAVYGDGYALKQEWL